LFGRPSVANVFPDSQLKPFFIFKSKALLPASPGVYSK